jgi:hypothetical protein
MPSNETKKHPARLRRLRTHLDEHVIKLLQHQLPERLARFFGQLIVAILLTPLFYLRG